MPEIEEKLAISTDDLNEVRASLESSMDTKLDKMESKIDQLRDFLTNLIMNKSKPTVVLNEDEDPLSEAALRLTLLTLSDGNLSFDLTCVGHVMNCGKLLRKDFALNMIVKTTQEEKWLKLNSTLLHYT